MKPEVRKLIALVLAHAGKIPLSLWNALSKQDTHFLEKWADKGLWEYGVSPRSGWLTEAGEKKFKESGDE